MPIFKMKKLGTQMIFTVFANSYKFDFLDFLNANISLLKLDCVCVYLFKKQTHSLNSMLDNLTGTLKSCSSISTLKIFINSTDGPVKGTVRDVLVPFFSSFFPGSVFNEPNREDCRPTPRQRLSPEPGRDFHRTGRPLVQTARHSRFSPKSPGSVSKYPGSVYNFLGSVHFDRTVEQKKGITIS